MVNIEDTVRDDLYKLFTDYGEILAQSIYLKATKDLENDTDCYKRYVEYRQKLFSLENKMVWTIKKSLSK